MFKIRIPERYKYSNEDLIELIESIAGNISIDINGRFIKVNYSFSAEELQQLKTGFINICEEYQELTI